MVKQVDRAYLILDGQEFECSSITAKGERDSHDTVMAMNRRNRAIGHKGGIPKFELSVEISLPEDGHAIDFDSYMLDEETFTTVIEYKGGRTKSYYDCQITSVEEAPSTGENVVTKLEIKALDMGVN